MPDDKIVPETPDEPTASPAVEAENVEPVMPETADNEAPPSVDPVKTEAEAEQQIDTPPQPSSDPLTKAEGSVEQSESQRSTTGPPVAETKPTPTTTPPPKPQLSTIISKLSAPDLAAMLSEEQLRSLAQLYTKRTQKQISAKGVAKRKANMELNLREIVDYLSQDNGAPLPRIAKRTNITPGTTSKYLRQLMAQGKVRAEGWGKTRRYYLK